MDVIDERELFRSVSLIFRALLIVVSQPNLMFVWVFFFLVKSWTKHPLMSACSATRYYVPILKFSSVFFIFPILYDSEK